MKVKELREMLEILPEEADVFVSDPDSGAYECTASIEKIGGHLVLVLSVNEMGGEID